MNLCRTFIVPLLLLLAPLSAAHAQTGVRLTLGMDSNNWKIGENTNQEDVKRHRTTGFNNARIGVSLDQQRVGLAVVRLTTFAYFETMLKSGDLAKALTPSKWQYPGVGVGLRVNLSSYYVSGGVGVYRFNKDDSLSAGNHLGDRTTLGGRLFVGTQSQSPLFYEVGVSAPSLKREEFTPGVALQVGLRL